MGRELKKTVLQSLKQADFPATIEALRHQPTKKLISPLISYLCHQDGLIKWHAVSCIGIVVSQLAQNDKEAARVVLRRLMWSLNDESGGIGWGAAEAMGDILARNRPLAHEYHRILISYINPDGNYITHEPLQVGVLWGLARLAHAHSDLAGPAIEFIAPHATSGNALQRGLSALLLTAFETLPPAQRALLKALGKDQGRLELYTHYRLIECSVQDIVNQMVGQAISD